MESEISTGRANDKSSISHMRSPREKSDRLTPSQQRAIAARGNVLVMAGAGTGKTKTLVERCLDCLERDRASFATPLKIDELLIVTFTEAAAAEMRQRLRKGLEEKIAAHPDNHYWQEQRALLDAAHIGTLHGFCFKLVREHFYELGLDPQPAILDEGEARLLADETLEEVLREQYEGRDELASSVQQLIQNYGGARDEKIRSLVLRLHHYAQTRPDADGWLAGQIAAFSPDEPATWRAWLLQAIHTWRAEWLPLLENLSANEKAGELAALLRRLPESCSRESAAGVLEQIVSADANWPAKRKTILRAPLEDLFDEAKFLLSLAAVKNGTDPLAEDWRWVRGHMTALLRLAQNFAARFAARKRNDGVLDFHDLEQFALKLLWDFAADKPAPAAEHWREKLRFVFVDEYQDINAAQDKIIQALSRDGARANRFLVGDVKQSIYRFRLAEPAIFRAYSETWRGRDGAVIPLSDNFRSRESLLHFVNSVFGALMREEVGGVSYGAEVELKFGLPEQRADFSLAKDPSPRAELLLRIKDSRGGSPSPAGGGDDGLAELEESEKDARLLARRLLEWKDSGDKIWDDEEKAFRPAEWRDMAVLLRSPAGKAEIFARQFEQAGVPLVVARGGFYDSSEILDWLSLLELLDNPLQDVPAIAVLRSPLVGCSVDELAEIRLAAGGHFWFAINQCPSPKSGTRRGRKLGNFWNGSGAGGNWRGRFRSRNVSRRRWRKRITPTGCKRSRAARNGGRTLTNFSVWRSGLTSSTGRGCFAS
jgi:ATP-dependent helicase/nuclease subunit A